MNQIESFYYVTAATGEKFIQKYTKFALRSLINSGVSTDRIHVVCNNKQDAKLLRRKAPDVQVHKISEDLSKVTWTVFSKIRKYSLFKAAA